MVVARPGDISDVAIEPEMRVERHAERLQLGCDPQRAAGDVDNWWAVQYGRFLPRDAMLSAVYGIVVCLSVSLCVCLSHSGIVSHRLNVESRK